MDLRLNLDDANFEQLLEKGRSMIPGLAPDWTDHNIHDPGIMLLDLLAYEAEAQIYALSALRRDERIAYARLLGIEPRQPNPAAGLIWPSQPPQPLPQGGWLLEPGTRIVPDHPEAPGFVTDLGGGPAGSAWRQILTDARLVKLETEFGDGRTADQTRVNGKNSATFLPFGPEPAAGDSLVLSFEGKLDMPGADTVLTLGAETPTPTLVEVSPGLPSPLTVTLRDDNGEQGLVILRDTTAGLLQSGIIILARPSRRQSGTGFQLVLRSGGGFLRPPRLRRIAPNVIPVVQRRGYPDEPIIGNDLPDQTHLLEFKSWIADPVFTVVERRPGAADQQWTSVGDFSKSGPDDRHFTFDPVEGELQFGNGINGMVLPGSATISIEYFVSSGTLGNLGSGNAWTLAGLAGAYGQNSEACSGGRDADTIEELQIRAIEHLSRREPLVTRDDLADAARALPRLGVARAIELRPSESEPRGTRTLLVVAERDADVTGTPESPPWLKAVRQSLAARIPLGQRLRVIAPKYVDIRISARLVLTRTADPAAVARDAEARLMAAFALTNPREPTKAWGFGRDVTTTAIKGWLRGITGVAKVVDVKLRGPNGQSASALGLAATALPRLIFDAGDVVLERPGEAQR